MSKSIADESCTSLASSNPNSQNLNSTSPSPWSESRSASAVEFDPQLDIGRLICLAIFIFKVFNYLFHPYKDSKLIQAKFDLFHEDSSTMFEDFKPNKAPPLPPLPICIQQKYQKKLSNHKINDTISHIKSEPILINSSVKFPSNNAIRSQHQSEESSNVSGFESVADTESFRSVESSGKDIMKF